MNESQTVGDIVSTGRNKALKSIAITLSLVVYIGMLIYSFVHNYTLMSKGVPPDMLMWAILGVISLELTAIALPIALHWWTHSNMQRFVALGFYVVDLGLMFMNVILNFALTAGEEVPEWMAMYLQYAMPATPIIAGIGWTMLWLLDPSHKAEQSREGLREATRESITDRMAIAARSPAVNEMVDQAAHAYAWQIIQSTLGADPALLGTGPSTPLVLPAAPPIQANQPWTVPMTAATAPGKNNKKGEPAPDLQKLLESLKSLGISPDALAALLATQPAQAPMATYAAEVEAVDPRPNGRGG